MKKHKHLGELSGWLLRVALGKELIKTKLDPDLYEDLTLALQETLYRQLYANLYRELLKRPIDET
jgi:hypothetical protein